ncbi:SDR family NAD(P)-dependent oxidoreductase [Nocardia sp. ET3-3]|uniref:SDR family NAD(P)-dependent oxidoreductase n=1 Tax=Nocardia terrae TaxID=2675851 RepID=A0A7K1VAR9_9NOCA|nr:SDR family NAD(P)-dependent oxidoreductase [Nocardia terrae]MVU83559.1 SDR family NAD(P)-dependent oxidoreductase [Nocardia terrae]
MSDFEIAELKDRVVLITGSTDGLGRYLATTLGAAGARVIVHGRDRDRAAEVAAEIVAAGGPEPWVITADLSQLAEVDRLADEVVARTPRLDVLVNNAGIGFGSPGAPRELTPDGIELRWAVNYLAAYRLGRRLLPLLVAAAPARIVNVASLGQLDLDFDDLNLDRGYDGVTAYRRSKLAMIMSTIDLAAELSGTGVTVNALHPATFMATTMVTESGVAPASTVAEGGEATLRLIADPALSGTTGEFFNGRSLSRPLPQAEDPQARRRLREATDATLTAVRG